MGIWGAGSPLLLNIFPFQNGAHGVSQPVHISHPATAGNQSVEIDNILYDALIHDENLIRLPIWAH